MAEVRSNLFDCWKGPSCYTKDSHQQHLVRECTKAIKWDALLQYASRLKDGMKCHVLPQSTMGGCPLAYLIHFDDGTHWIARFPLDPPTTPSARELQTEVDTMALIRDRTELPLPRVFGFDTQQESGVWIPFMLMEYLPGIVAMDADGGYDVHHGEIAACHKPDFYEEMASIQVSFPAGKNFTHAHRF